MRNAFFLALFLAGCGHAPVRVSSLALDAVLAAQLDGPWDQGARLDALRADLLPSVQDESIPSVKRIASELSLFDVQIKANARKWLAVKGLKQ